MTYPGFQRCSCSAKSNDEMAGNFIRKIEQGYIHPEQMVKVLQAMHEAMLDRFEDVALWLSVDLEQAADDLHNAIGCAERDQQDHPEEVAA